MRLERRLGYETEGHRQRADSALSELLWSGSGIMRGRRQRADSALSEILWSGSGIMSPWVTILCHAVLPLVFYYELQI